MADVYALLDTWIEHVKDPELLAELTKLKEDGDTGAITDAFFQDLEFGTAGLRGTIGAGTNRMNIYTVGRATQGFADYLNQTFDNPTVAIARDSRNKGELFVKTTASILAANGVTSYIYPKISPVPTLSWATRYLNCSGGICMTASHNPAPYNGYKAYGPDGCQITSEAAAAISAAMQATDPFADVKTMDFDEAVEQGLVRWIDDSCLDAYYDAVVAKSVNNLTDEQVAQAPLKLVYTPLNGTGLIPVTEVLKRVGVTDITIVPEQRDPDGNFPTCPYPNPEIREAMQKGIELCQEVKPDLLLATDPDADRVGVACADGDDYTLITGNEMGVLLLDYICKMRLERGEDLSHKVAVTTIVSSAMVDALAQEYGFEMRRVLTGFKYIGDQIDQLKDEGEEDRFLMGFEESYGYLVGTHARDKDAIVAVEMCVEMAAYYAERGMDLYEAMEELYKQYGYYLNGTVNAQFPGEAGAKRMAQIMTGLRENPLTEISGYKVVGMTDFGKGAEMPRVSGLQKEPAQELPAANVIEYRLEDDNKVIFRPSGTEPKVKAYLFAKGATRAEAEAVRAKLQAAAEKALS